MSNASVHEGPEQMAPKSNWKDLREYLKFLETKKDIVYIKDEVDPTWEIGGLTRVSLQQLGPCVVFENIKGADYPCVTGTIATDRRFLWALGIEKWSELNEEWSRRTKELIPPKIVEDAVCQEEYIKDKDIDINKICNIHWHALDKKPFSGTLSISVTKDPDTGVHNAGIYRHENHEHNILTWGAPEYTHGRQHLLKWERRGQPMPIAIVTGVDPITLMVGATRTSPNVDEFQLAGALRGEPLEMVKCQTIDLLVPATAEWVFEGYIYPGARRMEETEWFGEYTGHYGEQRLLPEIKITHITHRKNPIYQGTREQWYPSESFYLNGRTSQAEAYKTLKQIVPGIIDLRCNVAYEAIVQIDKLFKGHPQQVIDAVWGSTYSRYKHVIVVDQDIDIWDYEQVHWALSTRVKADRDVTITSNRAGQWLDPATPLHEKGWQSGMGIDATMPNEYYEFWGDEVPRTVADSETVARVKEESADILAKILG